MWSSSPRRLNSTSGKLTLLIITWLAISGSHDDNEEDEKDLDEADDEDLKDDDLKISQL